METFKADETIYEVRVIKISKEKKEQSVWQAFRQPYPDERAMTEEEKRKDPQSGWARKIEEVEVKEEKYNQRVYNLDMKALIMAVNKIEASDVLPHVMGAKSQ